MNAWLIAEREFRAYAATASFWIALVLGPLMMVGGLSVASLAKRPPAPVQVAVTAPDPQLTRAAVTALLEAARVEGRHLTVTAGADQTLSLSRRPDGNLAAGFSKGFPLSAPGRALALRTLERDAARTALGAEGFAALAIDAPKAAPRAADPEPLRRFVTMAMLWLVLTGSLGMLLQAVARERANRALECLLAAARPIDIVLGKVIGVGAVSVLVLGAWLAASAALAPLAPAAGGMAAELFAGLARPQALLRTGLIYLLGYAFYGLVTVAVGGVARDTAAAQNLSRPMFAVLLAAFFVAMAANGGALAQAEWLVFLPPLTPFLLLTHSPGPAAELVAVALLCVATALAGGLAVRSLRLAPSGGFLGFGAQSSRGG